MAILTTDICDLIRELRAYFFAKDRDVILQTDRVFGGNTTGAGTVPIGGIILWSGAVGAIPTGWALCDGGSGTPNLTDSFVVCAGGAYAVGATGGEDASNLAHTHGPGTLNTDSDSHTHGPGTLNTDSDNHNHTLEALTSGLPSETTTFGTAEFGPLKSTGTHTHSIPSGTTGWDSHDHDVNSGVTASDSHDHDVDSGVTASGGSAAQENRPVYYALAYIMRTS